ncbi:taurine dioxygenase [Pseudomonas sp. FW306-02-F02-AA]|uniref:Taurine dioxygenase n=1 Tax=Pseudomonas fluorescens TaxID=294 RepID=A0A0N9VNW3_PSEFL|nr:MULTISPECIES: taurine dioxygenase [Pseudomonas]ALI01710.1 taurine dioxygenase [Pseudomonas fluorescens]PMZ00697.1 taurine dioxygenase [Pseudomonas sp. FW306-02-F02-AB]PMZ08594.1 taurine dioxygenase [Pseudomonas sp. FW306-02-H06C]PMZ14512.1 taurine dioxygenase [Pseudomonas sp. FW306-02-F02-AA]PMZ19938.1 taurine dioxygenase [Pseudomonas sp. FW306-02-F08-AA]
MSSLTVTPLSTALGAQISGVDISQPLNLEQRDAIEQALLKHQVLFFREQPINPQQQARFATNFGDLHIHPIYPNVPEQPEVLILDTTHTDVRDNAVWHTDVTFLPTPALGAVLSAKLLPEFGGDTLWASGIAAYEALSTPLQNLLQGLTATHDFVKSFPLERFGTTPEALVQWEAARKKNPPLSHPVIRTHPVSGRKSLFVNEGFTTKINELSETESEAILKLLFAHATRPEFTIRWRWQENDVAFWDNRVTQHFAVDDYRPARRVMHRATVLGDVPFFR